MPIIDSTYRARGLFRNGHFSTIYSGIIRKVNGVQQNRERIDLDDGDFLDLDWSFAEGESKSLVILLHGLEGNASRPYILGSARYLNGNGYDCVAVNFRGCSGVENKLWRSYHSGATEDLDAVVRHVVLQGNYSNLFIKGFSLGGNICLKYLGETWEIPKELKAAMAVSVPCDLYGSMLELHSFKNYPYALRFKRHLLDRLNKKMISHPDVLDRAEVKKIATLKDFDDVYTSRAHGFKDAFDYYEQCSSKQFLPNIKIPALILNAKNDSFLSRTCYPVKEAQENIFLQLEMPDHGGHVGFHQINSIYYNERRACEFYNSI